VHNQNFIVDDRSLVIGRGQVMQNKLHKCRESWIAIVASHVAMWRGSNDWSRETVTEAIVNKYAEMYPKGLPGIEKFSDHSDVFTRHTTNSARIFRWLDDFQKDKNLLGANFLPVILQAMPNEIRIHCINEMLRPMNVVANVVDNEDQSSGQKPLNHLKALIKEGSEACQAISELIDGETCDELVNAQKEILELKANAEAALSFVNSKLSQMNITQIAKSK